MAGARTPGIGKGVNWGAFGSMGQQYAQIGRTIESGGSALGQGLGGGLAAIGGAIERKRTRDQAAAERQADRELQNQQFNLTRQDAYQRDLMKYQWDVRRTAIEDKKFEQDAQLSALKVMMETGHQAIQARDAGLIDDATAADAVNQAMRASSAYNAKMGGMAGQPPRVGGVTTGGGLSMDGQTSSAVERPSREALGDMLGEQAASKNTIPGYAPQLSALPAEIRQIAKVRALAAMIEARNKDLAALSNKPKDLIKRRALIREMEIYTSKAKPIADALELRGMARKNNLAAEKEKRAEEGFALRDKASALSAQREERVARAAEESARLAADAAKRAQQDQEMQVEDRNKKKADEIAKADAEILDQIDRPRPGDVDSLTRLPVSAKDAAKMSVLTPGRLKGFLDRNPKSPKRKQVIDLLKDVYGIDYAQGTDQAAAELGAAAGAVEKRVRGPDGKLRPAR